MSRDAFLIEFPARRTNVARSSNKRFVIALEVQSIGGGRAILCGLCLIYLAMLAMIIVLGRILAGEEMPQGLTGPQVIARDKRAQTQ